MSGRPECPNCLRPVIGYDEPPSEQPPGDAQAFCWEGIPCRAPDGYALTTAEIRDMRAEIDRLTARNTELARALFVEQNTPCAQCVARREANFGELP